MINPNQLQWPPPPSTENQGTGLVPVDFILEQIIGGGLLWFKTDTKAPGQVFSHLKLPILGKYGQKKIDEIAAFIRKYDVRVVQSFAMIPEQLPCISIQLLDGGEMPERAGLSDHEGFVDAMNAQDEVLGRQEIKFSPITDSVHIGIHAADTPDLAKYLYYLVTYVLLLYKPELEKLGLHLSTFRATDISRLNEHLPSNCYSRFINFNVFSIARVDTGDVPIVQEFVGVHASQSDTGTDVNVGISLSDIKVEGEF